MEGFISEEVVAVYKKTKVTSKSELYSIVRDSPNGLQLDSGGSFQCQISPDRLLYLPYQAFRPLTFCEVEDCLVLADFVGPTIANCTYHGNLPKDLDFRSSFQSALLAALDYYKIRRGIPPTSWATADDKQCLVQKLQSLPFKQLVLDHTGRKISVRYLYADIQTQKIRFNRSGVASRFDDLATCDNMGCVEVVPTNHLLCKSCNLTDNDARISSPLEETSANDQHCEGDKNVLTQRDVCRNDTANLQVVAKSLIQIGISRLGLSEFKMDRPEHLQYIYRTLVLFVPSLSIQSPCSKYILSAAQNFLPQNQIVEKQFRMELMESGSSLKFCQILVCPNLATPSSNFCEQHQTKTPVADHPILLTSENVKGMIHITLRHLLSCSGMETDDWFKPDTEEVPLYMWYRIKQCVGLKFEANLDVFPNTCTIVMRIWQKMLTIHIKCSKSANEFKSYYICGHPGCIRLLDHEPTNALRCKCSIHTIMP